MGFPGGSVVKTSPAMQESQEMQVQSLGWEDPLEEGVATPVFLLGESHGQRSLVGCTVHRAAKNQARLKRFSMHACIWASVETCSLFLSSAFSYPIPNSFLPSPLTAGASGAERWARAAAGHPPSLPWVCSLPTSRTYCLRPPLRCELCAGAASPSLEEAVGFCCN